jgi:hypothetical protein
MYSHISQDRLACNIVIDYSSVPGSRILPLEFSLNLEDSVLEPAPGQRQRFSYHIRAMGSEEFCYVNLSYFMIGMCEDIDESQLGAISVTRNGIPEKVIPGENVTLATSDAPDHNTGCSGLKFHFPLDKVHGEMDVSFELTTAYRDGPRSVCVYGCGVSRNVLSLCGPSCRMDENCARIAHQRTRVSVPITLAPYVHVGDATTWCCGAPVFRPSNCKEDTHHCTFVVSQMMCVSVPITFCVDANAGDADIECLSSIPCEHDF